MKIQFIYIFLIHGFYLKVYDGEEYLSTDDDNKNMLFTNEDRARDFSLKEISKEPLLHELKYGGRTLSMAGTFNKKLKMVDDDRGRSGLKIVYAGLDKYIIQRNDSCLVKSGNGLEKKDCNSPTFFQMCETKSNCLSLPKKIDLMFDALCLDNGDNRDNYYNDSDRGGYHNSRPDGYRDRSRYNGKYDRPSDRKYRGSGGRQRPYYRDRRDYGDSYYDEDCSEESNNRRYY